MHIINKEQPQISVSQIPNTPTSITSGSLSYSSFGHVMYNLDFQTGEYIFMSPSVELLTGYSKNELNEIGFKSIVKKVYSNKIDRYKVNGDSNLSVEEFYAKYLIETKSGENKWIEDNSFAYLDKDGDRLNAVGILRDTSSLHAFIDKLNEEKNKLDKIFDLSDTMLIQVDKDLKIMMINKKGCRVFGGDKKEIIGKNLNDFIPKHLQSNFEQYIDEIINGDDVLTRSTVGKLKTFDNKIKTIEWHNTLLRDKNGELISIIASGQEITERRREEKIRKIISEILDEANSGKHLYEVFKFIHKSISKLMKAENFYIAYHNREQNLLTFPYCVDKYDDDSAPKKLGKGLTEYVLRTGKSVLVDKKKDSELLQKGETELIGEQSEIWLGVPLKIQNKVIGVLVVQDYEDASTYTEIEQQILDVVAYPISRAIERKIVDTEREKLIIQLQELNASKDQLFSLISHDLRNPFNSLLGFADILATEFDSLTKEEIKEYNNVINESAKNLYGMTNNLLHYSRYQLGKFDYRPRKMNMGEVIRIVLETQKHNIKKKDILLIKEIDQSISVFADEDLISIAFGNIVENAIKYTNKGGMVKISVEKIGIDDSDKSSVKIIIEDDGVGIPEENLVRIENKEMFSTPGTMREFGIGLGLFLSRDFITTNNGKLQIKSEKGKGTTVSIDLPDVEHSINI
ncbi:MAG: PAS domain S-box protein [Bacteroidetes bacterium]|nr:PAS domain S-box protein [Bacteroidota bacterium]